MSAETSTDLQWELMTAKDSEACVFPLFWLMEHNISILCIACSTLLGCSFPYLFGFPKAQLKEQLAEAKAAEVRDEKILI